MPKPLLPLTIALLVILATPLACSESTPTPDSTGTPATTSIAAAPALPANTPMPEVAATPTATERPTAAPPTATPASSPTPEPTSAPVPDGRLAPLVLQDSRSLQSALSAAELSCIGDDPESLTRALTGAGVSGGDKMGHVGGGLLSIGDLIVYRLPSFIGL